MSMPPWWGMNSSLLTGLQTLHPSVLGHWCGFLWNSQDLFLPQMGTLHSFGIPPPFRFWSIGKSRTMLKSPDVYPSSQTGCFSDSISLRKNWAILPKQGRKWWRGGSNKSSDVVNGAISCFRWKTYPGSVVLKCSFKTPWQTVLRQSKQSNYLSDLDMFLYGLGLEAQGILTSWTFPKGIQR